VIFSDSACNGPGFGAWVSDEPNPAAEDIPVADWNPRANDLFLKAAEFAQPAERQAFLDRECADPHLRRDVEALLAASAKVDSFLKVPAVARPNGTVAYEPISEAAGTVIGPYKLLQQIGEGGFGVVYMAEQEKPVRRMVALKIIKPGMDTAQVIARFESERQALALMDHPNIAKVLDAGATESGRPYFVMELVKGVPITEFCDKNHLPADQRLKLFIDVCHAIQHAHHKGVIHRDVKPSNVMVTLHDGVPVVKVIDFGVAKATVQKLTERTLFTAYGQMIGTPAYMSPEQAEMSGLDIDTRSDVYSLGVLLYELLTGTTPLTSRQLREAGYVEMQRLIREQEAQRPSTRMSSLGDSATILAGNRGSDVRRLTRLLAGDLDWIVMKALEKDRNRRYGTPGNFADDVDRYLGREAILARPASTAYKLKKFARRNRAVMVMAAAVSAALFIGTTVATWQAVVATRAQRTALDAAAAEKLAKETAEQRDAESRAVLDFVETKVFAVARPEGQAGGLGRDVLLRRAIEAAMPFVDKSFAAQPLLEARLRLTLGTSFSYLGEPRLAAEQCEAALPLFVRYRGPDHPDTLKCRNELAVSYAALGRHAEAATHHGEALAGRIAILGRDHIDTLGSMVNLALDYAALGRHAEAIKLYQKALPVLKASFPDHQYTVNCLGNLATSLDNLGRPAEALTIREETTALRTAGLGPDHLETASSKHDLANSYLDAGRNAEALKLHQEVLTLRQRRLGPDHPDTLASMHSVARDHFMMGQHAAALKLVDETVARQTAKLGPEHPETLKTMMGRGHCYAALGRQADALDVFAKVLAVRKAKLGPGHPILFGPRKRWRNPWST
jgi:serine/threonine protein kinase/tetratricopeptide (TPR) repeat protein